MRTLFLTLCLACVLAPALGQGFSNEPNEKYSDQTYEHQFEEDFTVYVEVSPALVKVWGVEDGECRMLPNVVTFKGNIIEFPGGTKWTTKITDKGIDITFPSGKTVAYVRSDDEPEAICGLDHRDT